MAKIEAPTIHERLAQYFPLECIHWRVGSTNRKKFEAKQTDKRRGKPLAYLDARDVMDRLDAVCGPEGWQDEYIDAGNGATCCRIGIRILDEWIWKSDGAGRTDYEGDKGQFSDSFKRAAVKHGIGRYLYGHDTPWIELDEYWNIPKSAQSMLNKSLADFSGQSFAPKNDAARELYKQLETEIRQLKTVDGLNMWYQANKGERIAELPSDWQENIVAECARRKGEIGGET